MLEYILVTSNILKATNEEIQESLDGGPNINAETNSRYRVEQYNTA